MTAVPTDSLGTYDWLIVLHRAQAACRARRTLGRMPPNPLGAMHLACARTAWRRVSARRPVSSPAELTSMAGAPRRARRAWERHVRCHSPAVQREGVSADLACAMSMRAARRQSRRRVELRGWG